MEKTDKTGNGTEGMRNPRHLLIAMLFLGIALALIAGAIAVHAQPIVKVDADDVVRITRIVNYKDKMGNAHYGAKMNIIIFKRGR